MADRNTENEIEFIDGDKTCTVSFAARKFVNKMKKLHDKDTTGFERFVENEDGSVYARIPLNWLKISPPRHVEMSDEKKEELRYRMKTMQKKKQNG